MTSTASDLESAFRVVLPPQPYPGLRPFEKDEWPIFFGRERMADAVVSQLIEKRVLVVHGDSGCGKSSLVRAAVLPRLEQEHARGGIRWHTCAATPGEAPLWNLAEALAALDGSDRPAVERALDVRRALNLGARAPAALAALLRQARADHVCILLDQFEELFAHARRHGNDEAQLLSDVLVALHAQRPEGLYAVLTMRSEFLGACARFKGFAETVNATQYLLPRMDHDDLLRAIREPAVLYDGDVARDLAERLIADAGGGQDQLPLIQHGLNLLHRHNATSADPASGAAWRLELASYKHSGGLARLLSDHADAVLTAAQAAHPAGDPRVAEDVFRALTDINADGQAVRRPCTLAALTAIAGGDETAVRNIVDAFRREGVSFLKPYGAEPLQAADLIDISHEALVRCWSKISNPRDGWLAGEFKSGLVWRALLVQAESFETDPGNVLPPAATDERERWMSRRNAAWAARYGGGWDRVRNLLQASAEARDRERAEQQAARQREQHARLKEQRFKLLRAGLVILAVLLAAAVYLAYTARAEREEALTQFATAQAARDEAESARDEAEAQRARSDSSARALQELIAKLDSFTQSPTAPAPKTVEYAKDRIAAIASSLSKPAAQAVTGDNPAPAQASPRVYIQIADPGQRQSVRAFEARLESAGFDRGRIIVPGIELVKAPPPRSILRCFRAAECADEAKRLMEAINRLLAAPRVELDDLSGRYGSSSSIRPRHYELWFAAGPITLRSAAASAP